MAQLDFYFDLNSPFSYIALDRLAELPPEHYVNFKPVLLGVLLKHWGQLGPAEIAPKRIHTYRLACHLAQKQGLPIRFPLRHPFNPLGAMRMLAGADADFDMVKKAFRFIFELGKVPHDEKGLAELADFIDLPIALASDNEAKTKLRLHTDQAIANGVFGVPTIGLVDQDGQNQLFWGVDAFDMLLDWLANPEIFRSEPYLNLKNVEVSAVRK